MVWHTLRVLTAPRSNLATIWLGIPNAYVHLPQID